MKVRETVVGRFSRFSSQGNDAVKEKEANGDCDADEDKEGKSSQYSGSPFDICLISHTLDTSQDQEGVVRMSRHGDILIIATGDISKDTF